jgi:hypothetical protein
LDGDLSGEDELSPYRRRTTDRNARLIRAGRRLRVEGRTSEGSLARSRGALSLFMHGEE